MSSWLFSTQLCGRRTKRAQSERVMSRTSFSCESYVRSNSCVPSSTCDCYLYTSLNISGEFDPRLPDKYETPSPDSIRSTMQPTTTAQVMLSALLVLLVWMTLTVFTVTAHPQGTFNMPSECFKTEHNPSTSLKVLSPRNNYAMVCLQEKQFTDYCQKWSGCYCNSRGKLRTTMPYNEEKDFCEGHCECPDLSPKPNSCILGIAGSLYCRRDFGDQMSQASATVEADTSTRDIFKREESTPDAEPSNLLEARSHTNTYALVCGGQKDLTLHCQKEGGLYCSAVGTLKSTSNHPDDLCYKHCECVNLFPKPNPCFLGISSVAYHMRSADYIGDADASFSQHPSKKLDLFVVEGDETPNCLRTRDGETTCISSGFEWVKISDSTKDVDCNLGSAELIARYEDSARTSKSDSAALSGDLHEREEGYKSPFKKGDYVMVSESRQD